MSSSNQAIVINDLLSFFSCKVNDDVPRSKLIKSIREYYPEGVILKAQKLLLESVPVKKSTRHHRRLKHPDPLEAMYETFQLIPSEDLPIFVCRNLNNVPHLEHYPIKEEILDERELTIEEDYENSHQDIKDEQIAMKSQIADITDVVKQIKDQLKHIVQQQPLPSKPNNLSINGTKRRKSYVKTSSNPNKKFNAFQIEPSLRLKKNPKTSMAYIQKLIDEEADVKSESQYEDSQKDEYSDYLDELSEDEEKFVQSACEVVLQENLEGLDQINLLKGTPVKMQGEKIIYIKNEEEDFDFDNYSELQMDDENSIEISSADHFSSFDEIDSSNRMFLEVLGDGTINDWDKLKVSNLAGNTAKQTVKNTLVKPKLWCSLCGEKFDTEINLIEHISYHENGSTLKCSLCDFSTTIRTVIRNHLTTVHGDHFGGDNHKKRYLCVLCKFKTFSLRKIEIHVDAHFDKKNDSCYECNKCGKQYMSHASLRKHKKVHTGIKPFSCHICGDSFVFKTYLKTHMETHSDDRPLSCNYCDAKFISKMKLIRHERIHTGERPYSCSECDFRTARSDCLQNHRLVVHSKVKPFECYECGLSFSLKQQYRQHYQTNHFRSVTFRCKECEKEFKSKTSLKHHLKVYGHHEDDSRSTL